MQRKRPNIGLQITNLIEEYPKPIFKGAADAAEELDANLIVFRGESPNTPYGYGYQCNVIYDLIHHNYLDALILASGTLCNYIDVDEFDKYVKRFQNLPLVSISIPLKDVPSILIDNTTGIREAVRHLVLNHERKKIAFIKGPGTNQEANHRFEIFRNEMKKLDVNVYKKLIVSGNWTENSGREAVIELLAGGKAEFDSLIACNDNMAIGAMNELIYRGIDIPDRYLFSVSTISRTASFQYRPFRASSSLFTSLGKPPL